MRNGNDAGLGTRDRHSPRLPRLETSRELTGVRVNCDLTAFYSIEYVCMTYAHMYIHSFSPVQEASQGLDMIKGEGSVHEVEVHSPWHDSRPLQLAKLKDLIMIPMYLPMCTKLVQATRYS